MKKVIINLVTVSAILLLCTKCMAQTKQDTLKSYSGYKFKLPARVKVTSLGGTTYFDLVDTAGSNGNLVYYKGWDERTGRHVEKLSQKGLKLVK